MMKFETKQYIQIGKILWVALVVAFLAYYLKTHYKSFSLFLTKIPLPSILLAISCAITAKILLSYQMVQSIRTVKKSVTKFNGIYVYSVSDLSKYIPGGIWAIALRSTIYKRIGLDMKQIFKAFCLEYLWLLGSGLLFGLCACLVVFSYHSKSLIQTKYGINSVDLLAPTIITLFVLWACFTQLFHYFILKKFATKMFMFMLLLRQFLIWPLFGVSIYLLLPSLELNRALLLLLAIGSLSLGKILGIVVIFAPGGLGMREGVIAFILSYFVSSSKSIFIAICNRAILFLADMILGIVSISVYKVLKWRAPDAKLQNLSK